MSENVAILDKIKRLVIIAMFSDDDLMDRLVLKGGNLIDLVYGISPRASMDVDFSLDGEFESEKALHDKVSRVLKTTFEEVGYVVFDLDVRAVPPKLSDNMKDFWGGYQVKFKLIEQSDYDSFKNDISLLRRRSLSVGKRGSTNFKIDISKHEYCTGKLAQEFDDYTIYTYSPQMLVCEKIRAICQQMPEYVAFVMGHHSGRARDFVDIHTVAEHFLIDFTTEPFHRTLENVFRVKRVPLRLLGEMGEFRDYHREDFSAVQDTVKPGVTLKDFDFYFDYVLERCKPLESLWNE